MCCLCGPRRCFLFALVLLLALALAGLVTILVLRWETESLARQVASWIPPHLFHFDWRPPT